MNTLKYKGFIGSVGYSEPDKVFYGKIEGIDGLVNYEGESVSELTQAFHEAVEDYLALCEAEGIKPEKSYSGSFNVRILPETHRAIANRAAEAGISINAFVKRVLMEAVQSPMCSAGNEYGHLEAEPALLMEPDQHYGSEKPIQLTIPARDSAFAQELARRMGWKTLE